MPLGSAVKSTIDIDFTRAQGINSSGYITFEPPRIRVGSTVVSSFKIRVPVLNGIGSVELVRLTSGTYRVREEIDGQAPYEFNFSLPLSAPATIQYEEIAAVDPVPLVYTVVRTVNGQAPDPTTGNINIAGGGATGLNELEDVVLSSAQSGHVLVYDGVETVWENRTPAQLKATLSLSKADVGLSSVDNTPDASKPVSTAQAEAINQRLLPPRLVRVKDKSKEGAGNTYDLPNTSNTWSLFTAGPSEMSIQANVGDNISVYYDFLMQIHVSSFFDFAVVTGVTPVIQRYLSSGTSTPSFNGPSGSYPSNEGFQGVSGMLDFNVEAGDLDSGMVRLRWVIKTSTATGKIYANNNYPLTVGVANTRLSGL